MDHRLILTQIESWSLQLLTPSQQFEPHQAEENIQTATSHSLSLYLKELEELTQAHVRASITAPPSASLQPTAIPEDTSNSHPSIPTQSPSRNQQYPSVFKDEAVLRALLKLNHTKTAWKKSPPFLSS